MNSSKEFDLIIFGATGFTGFYVLRELLLSLEQRKSEYEHLKWAIAGRNEQKMTMKLEEVGQELNKNLENVTKIVADCSNTNSLLEMAKRSRLIINCVGPYCFYGRPVVQACVEAGTHHIDISGEPNYIEAMAIEFHNQAKEKGLIIISTCGWDSIPCDLGVQVTKQKFPGRLHSVETFVSTIPGSEGYKINTGTLNSAINGYRTMNELRAIRRRLYSEVLTVKIPRSRIVLKRKTLPFTRDEVSGWNVEFPGSDRSVVQRTQYYNYEHFKEPPLQIQTYFTVASFTHLMGLIVFAAMFAVMTATSFGSRLLSRYPEVFTAGAFSKKGPTRAQIESSRFRTTIIGRGWSKRVLEQQSNPDDVDSEPETEPDETITVQVSGRDPGYMATSTCLIQSGLTILMESDNIPRGVLTPASAFRNTHLLDRLQERDFTIEVVSSQRIEN
ncbi:saccharopine dehydrogenase-like oxidoreductase [Dermatophagoides pteronyssinus]|uniref:Saccharopine dehydrogenase-like oxidoreductase n=1 Tax=Dermatophagoides pteronyssinus TaxID=6956 RepID=A0A6P6YLM5_DERPT|nr:saccharopine dehydrogenase-like oxidoreductase [Dermatophagoides pteronyssinus]